MRRLRPYLAIMRVDHWFKNVMCLPGMVLACVMTDCAFRLRDLPAIALGMFAIGLTASANYTLNEILDAPYDLEHPDKRTRPVPSGLVRVPLGYLQYGLLTVLGLGLGALVNVPFTLALLTLWIMGTVYNVPPLRTKEVTYVDTLSEAVNNPIRLALGWWMISPETWPPLSILVGYWMLGAFLMALKRSAEYRHIGDRERAVRYRKSFAHTDDLRLLISAVIYSNAFYLLLGVFIAKFRVELILAVPFLALFGAYYMRISFRKGSLVQSPEKLYREKKLVTIIAVTCAVTAALLFVDMPFLDQWLRMQEPAEPAPISIGGEKAAEEEHDDGANPPSRTQSLGEVRR